MEEPVPTYVYRCTECEHEFEVFAKMSDQPRARKCPVCGNRAQRQISGGAGFLFKGEGFYITDYRSEEYRTKAKADREPSKEEPVAKTPKAEAGKTDGKKDASSDGSSKVSDARSGGRTTGKPTARKSRKPPDAQGE